MPLFCDPFFITLLQQHAFLWHIAFTVIPTSGISPWQHLTSLIHKNELCALRLSLFLFLFFSLSLSHPWVLQFF